MPAATAAFAGFEPAAIEFMADLAANNDRAWFAPRKADYERLIKAPVEALCVALAERFGSRGIPLRSDPKRSPFRIYRDTRFSRDKSPYKTHIGVSFPWIEPEPDGAEATLTGAHASGGYFSLAPGRMYVGGGMWHPEKPRLDAFRRTLLDDPDRVRAALEDRRFVAEFGSVTSETYLRRVPPGFPPDHPLADLARARDVIFGRDMADDEVLSPALPDTLTEAFDAAMPVLRLLATVRA